MSKFQSVTLSGAIMLVLGVLLVSATKQDLPVLAHTPATNQSASIQESKPTVAVATVRSPVNQSKLPSPLHPLSSRQAEPPAAEEVNLEDQSREMHALVEQQMAHPSGDPNRDISDQFELLVITTLGRDFPQDRLDLVMAVQHEMSKEGDRIDEAFRAGDLTQDELMSANAQLFRKAAKRFSSILTRDEYFKLFGMEPTDDPAGILIPPGPG